LEGEPKVPTKSCSGEVDLLGLSWYCVTVDVGLCVRANVLAYVYVCGCRCNRGCRSKCAGVNVGVQVEEERERRTEKESQAHTILHKGPHGHIINHRPAQRVLFHCRPFL